MTAAESVRRDTEPVLLDLFNRLFPSVAVRTHREPWPFGSVLERAPDRWWDPTKVMHVASWDEHHIEVVHLIGPRAGERERVNPLGWRLVPETGF